MITRMEAEALIRAAASGAIPSDKDILIRTEAGWIFGPVTVDDIPDGSITPDMVDSLPFTKILGEIADDQVPESAVTQHEAALSLLFTQLTDSIANSQVPESAVTQHEAALSLLFTQLSDQIADGQVPESAVTQHEAALSIAFTQITGVSTKAQLPSSVAYEDEINMFTLNQTFLSNLDLAASTVLEWGSDANLYRDSANVVKTDDDFVVGGDVTVLLGGVLKFHTDVELSRGTDRLVLGAGQSFHIIGGGKGGLGVGVREEGAGRFQTTGTLGIGAAPVNSLGVKLQFTGGLGAGGTSAEGGRWHPHAHSDVTSSFIAFQLRAFTIAAVFNIASVKSLEILNLKLQGGATVTTQHGIKIADLDAATTNIAIETGLGEVIFGDLLTLADNLDLAAGSVLEWGVDTNLFRDSANVLKTDDDFVVGAALSVLAGDLTVSTGDLLVTLGDVLVAAGAISAISALFIATATADAQQAIGIVIDANGFDDVRGLTIAYTADVAAGELSTGIRLGFDTEGTTGGDVVALAVSSTQGAADVTGLFIGSGVNPIRQGSGAFVDLTTALVNSTDRLTEFNTAGNDVQMFVADNDTVTCGHTNKFASLEFILAVVASNPGVDPIFEYSTGAGTWASFSPTDGTNGMTVTGVINWIQDDLVGWATGTGGDFLIRVTRTRNILSTPPTESIVQIAPETVFFWDKLGDVSVNTLTTVSLMNVGTALDVGTAANVGGDLTVVGRLVDTNTTVSTSSSTGAAVFSGGVGIGGNLYVFGVGVFGEDVLVGTLTSPSAGGGNVLVFGDNVGDPTMGADTAGVYGKDVDGANIEVFAIDEAAHVTPLIAAYGSIYVANGSTSQGSLGTTPAKVTGFVTNGLSYNTTPDHSTNDRITADSPGTFMVHFTVAFTGSALTAFKFEVYKNGSATGVIGLTRAMGGASDVGSASAHGFISMALDDYLEVFVSTVSGTNKSITPEWMALSAIRLDR